MAEQYPGQTPNQGNAPGQPPHQPRQGGYFPPPPGMPPPTGQPPGWPPQGPPPGQPPRKRHRVRNTVLAVVGVLVVLFIIAGIAGSKSGGKHASSGGSASATTAAAPSTPASIAPSFTAAEQTYISDMRAAATFTNTTDAQILTLGQGVCSQRTTGMGQRETERYLAGQLTGNGSGINQLTRISERDLCRKYLPPKPKPTVEYVVTGTPGAQVTYGPSGSNFNGSVPMDVKARLGNPQYYAIDAQLQGSGSVQCEIKVNGKVISQASANGGFNIASCEIDQNPLTGQWENTNG